jgi:hypothetical protein
MKEQQTALIEALARFVQVVSRMAGLLEVQGCGVFSIRCLNLPLLCRFGAAVLASGVSTA